MNRFLTALLTLLAFSCATIDYDNAMNNVSSTNQNNDNIDNVIQDELFVHEPTVQIIEKPIFVPAPETPPKKTNPGGDSVRASNNAGIIKPQDYSHAAMIYAYNPDWVYEIYTMPLRVSDICLQPLERVVDNPFLSDTERWIIGAGISYENGSPVQHIYIKPTAQGLEATLIINTDKRVYRIILKSFQNTHMPIIRWKYDNGIPNNYWSSPSSNNQDSNSLAPIDPRFLSFNYRIKYSIFSKPYWIPELVFDDGSKTYIRFPLQILQREMPSVFENKRDILNYRINGNLIIIDKLIENMTIRINKTEITIIKKRG